MRKVIHWLPVIVAIGLFCIPFFWLANGELDWGGDSNRLYFYDPIWYLLSNSFYGIAGSGFGLENINYLMLPIVSVFALLRTVMSPTVLISLFHGLSLSCAFYFTYLVVHDIIAVNENAKKVNTAAGMLAGLFYVLSPALILGWQYVLITRNQIFLNPFIFYFLFKYIRSRNVSFLIIVLLTSFIFSPNFSVIASPPVFAFYPISIVFLITYSIVILKQKIIIKHLGLALLGFLLLQLFHILPQFSGLFSKETTLYTSIFSSSGMYDRGLSYFLGIAPNIKASINLMGLPQMTELGLFSSAFLIVPAVILLSFLYNKKRTLPLLSIFIFLVLFFSTANITPAGFEFYRKLFDLPGFSMFRNFYGQWQFAYIFYLSLLLGLSISIVIPVFKKVGTGIFISVFVFLLLFNALPFIRGDILRKPLWQSNNVSPVDRMDPAYEAMLDVIRKLPHEGKILSLPLTDYGYQVLGGLHGGAYMGPSTLSYLAGRQDFTGYEEFWGYKNIVLDLFKTGQLEEAKKLMGVFNIKYIFYNADPIIYDKFPDFPYTHVRKFFPSSQQQYSELVTKLNIPLVHSSGKKYFLYELPDAYFVPHIYSPNTVSYLRQEIFDVRVPLSWDIAEKGIGVYVSRPDQPEPEIELHEKYYHLPNNSAFADFFKNTNDTRLPWGFVSHRPDSALYPFVVWREKKALENAQFVDDAYIERSILYAEKRVNELLKYDRGIPILGDVDSIVSLASTFKYPSLYEALTGSPYNSWEVSLVRYYNEMAKLIDKVKGPNSSIHPYITNSALIERMMLLHKQRLFDAIAGNKEFSDKEQLYVADLAVEIFDALTDSLITRVPTPDRATYSLKKIPTGVYDVLIKKKSVNTKAIDFDVLNIGSISIPVSRFIEEGEWLTYHGLPISGDVSQNLEIINTVPTNLIDGNEWKLTGVDHQASVGESQDGIRLSFSNGLIWAVPNIEPNSYYYLTLYYETGGKDFRINWFEQEQGKPAQAVTILKRELRSNIPKVFETVIQTGAYSNSGYIQITKDGANTLIDKLYPEISKDEVIIKNLSLTKIPNPQVLLREAATSTGDRVPNPTITFERINPTRYKVSVDNVQKPFHLVFAQKYNPKWKLIDTQRNSDKFLDSLKRLAAFGLTKITTFRIGIQPVNNSVVANYYNNTHRQKPRSNIFWDVHSTDTWGKVAVPESRHFEVNGYANAWYLTPKDVGSDGRHTYIIELTTQQIFYQSFIISLLTLVVCVVWLVYLTVRR